ncbi:aldehyde dehydrogenase family protein [Mycobacterium haemophilum]|uniref:Aldehyde dehydrogenase n=1 Tax=Mycobacterium haemophilum TaxID=29311 RepID=A0A0I9ZQG2_9MYCO|nr:aldehyde dehydrogenase family protein [Mycobacterium haemophilum]KLO32285.1 aldehyde dehydrogenase [Mycobacterium haemophilum]KLO36693.1 aldehyde dehydrogenase [Mycobacterium haemophilum]KLO42621.1 aldehyde dehydrogenase [Mycobacterium haemophilum]KLO55497.1 aldehyde dehydrogenase [Mycobacterium haemophilum]
MVCLDALGPGGEYRTRNREVVMSTAGEPVAALSIVPSLYVSRSISAQRKIRPLPVAQREAALTNAADAFASTVIAELDFDTYVELASRISGLPIAVTRAGANSVVRAVAAAFDAVRLARPTGAAFDWREENTRNCGAVWTRRGEVLAVQAAGNGPGIHGLWPQALALGYRVAVRPSCREPLTAHRLVNALRQAGFRPEDVVYLPTDHRGADEIIRLADLAMVYGGQDVVDKYANDPRVLVNGPGRAKILISADRDWRDYIDIIVDSIASLGGMACVNTTAVLYEGDPAPLAAAIVERLARIEPLPAHDERAILPTQPIDAARALAGYLAINAAGTTALLGADQVVAPLSDGCAALRPAVHLVAEPDSATLVDKLNVELPFPCVWISPWSCSVGLEPLRRSLVVTAITGEEQLIDDLLAEPTISNVYSGHHSTCYAAPDIPHDGFLADALMRTKGFIRD